MIELNGTYQKLSENMKKKLNYIAYDGIEVKRGSPIMPRNTRLSDSRCKFFQSGYSGLRAGILHQNGTPILVMTRSAGPSQS